MSGASPLYGADEVVRALVGRELGETFDETTRGIGIVLGEDLVGGVVFQDYRVTDIHVSIATTTPRWFNRRLIAALFAYPFRQLGCLRITALAAASNEQSIRVLKGLGFRHEGTHPLGFRGVETALSFGALASECRWLRG